MNIQCSKLLRPSPPAGRVACSADTCPGQRCFHSVHLAAVWKTIVISSQGTEFSFYIYCSVRGNHCLKFFPHVIQPSLLVFSCVYVQFPCINIMCVNKLLLSGYIDVCMFRCSHGCSTATVTVLGKVGITDTRRSWYVEWCFKVQVETTCLSSHVSQ